MKVLVTGASGLLGSALLRVALESGVIAVAAYNTSSSQRWSADGYH